MARWAQPRCSREQFVLFAPTLDAAIPDDHPARLFYEMLCQLDFSAWEQRYFRLDGQPPIHPRIMAAVLLYGLSLGIRSSRRLEDATGNRIDMIWLCEGRVIDHSTLAGFRTRFAEELKDLFRQTGRLAIGMGLANLNQISLDGTTVLANNSRQATARRATLEQKLAALDEQVARLMVQVEQNDQKDQELFGETSPTKLPATLRRLEVRQKRLRQAMQRMEELEKKRAGRKDMGAKGPAVPTTDPDSAVLPNKTGGYAPNYTPVLATEGLNGFIMGLQVRGDNDEPASVVPLVQQVREAFGQSPQPAQDLAASSAVQETSAPLQPVLPEPNSSASANLVAREQPQAEQEQLKAEPPMPAEPVLAASAWQPPMPSDGGTPVVPEAPAVPEMPQAQAAPQTSASLPSGGLINQVLADSGFNSGPNLAALDQQNIEALMPAKQPMKVPPRSDPTQPLPQSQHVLLPVNPQLKILDKAAFIYDSGKDCYYCPMGRPLEFKENKAYVRDDVKGMYRVYESPDCSGCPLATRCLPGKSERRRVVRDEYESLREAMAKRMASPEGQKAYKRRSVLSETPLATMKAVMNVRQFLLRGIKKVGIEMHWIASAINLGKLVRLRPQQGGVAVMAG